MRKYLIIILLIFPLILSANFIGMNYGARSLAMGNAYVGLADEPTAVFKNPAGLAQIDQISIALSHQNLYGISDLYNEMAAFTIPIPYSTVGVGYTQINLMDVYSEQVIYFSAAGKVSLKNIPIRFGTSLKYFRANANGYENSNFSSLDISPDTPTAIGVDVGILVNLNKNLSVGFSGYDLNEPGFKFISVEDKLHRNFATGVCYQWRGAVNFLADYVWNKDDHHWNLGGEMWFYNVFAARIGMHGDKLTAGFGLKTKKWTVDGAVLAHDELGSTYRISLGLKFGRKK